MFRLPPVLCILGAFLILTLPVAAAPIGHAPVDFVDLGAYLSHNDLFLVFAPTSGDPDFSRQHDALAGQEAAIASRDLIVGMLTDDAGGTVGEVTVTPGAVIVLRAQLHVPVRQFTTLLISKDGDVKLRQTAPVNAATLFTLTDSTPAGGQAQP